MYRVPRNRQGANGEQEKHPEQVPGQFIVKFKRSATEEVARLMADAPMARRGRTAPASVLPDAIREPMSILRSAGVTSVKPLFVADVAQQRGRRGAPAPMTESMPRALARTAREPEIEALRGFQLVEVDTRNSAMLIKRLKATRAVEIVEPVPNRWPAVKRGRKVASLRPRTADGQDPMLNRQWGLTAIRWFAAKKPNASRVDVAILDSGIDTGHPELQSAIAAYEYGANGSDDKLGHGTHVAGIIAAIGGNGVGITGIARCQLHCWKIFSDPPAGSSNAGFDFQLYSSGLNQVLSNGIKVVNLSIGGTAHSKTEAILFSELADAGVIVAAAMGNEFAEGNPTEYPAAYDGVIAVGAIDEADRRAEFSCTGKHIKVVAPGVNILSTVPRTQAIFADATDYDSWPGTSMATPHVAGCAALLYAGLARSKANRDKIEHALIAKARKLPAMKGKDRTNEFGFGLIDLAKML